MIEHYVLDEHGNPKLSDIWGWAKMFEDTKSRTVKQEHIGGLLISTVFLGLNHNFTGSGPPVLWETMVFQDNPKKDYFWWVPNWVRRFLPWRWRMRMYHSKRIEFGDYTCRCSGNREQAEAMHNRVVKMVEDEYEKLDKKKAD